jgi:hypothetical protein
VELSDHSVPPEIAVLLEPPDLRALVERDGVLGFTASSATRARADLRRPELTPRERAFALAALGASGGAADRAVIASWAVEGEALERQAAVLALGELGSVDEEFLKSCVESESSDLADCAVLALLRGGGERGASYVQSRVALEGAAASRAGELAAFHRDPGAATEIPPAAALLLDLRFEAARRYGLVHGQAWWALIREKLYEDEPFLNEVVYRASAELRRDGIRDHFYELLISGSGTARIRGAVYSMPAELDQLFEAGLWTPADGAEWSALIDEIGRRHLETFTPTILRQARFVPGLQLLSSGLLVRAGNEEGLPLLELDLQSKKPMERAGVAQALAATGDRRYAPELERLLEDDPEADVRMSALVGLVQLGNAFARDEMRAGLADPDHPDHRPLVQAAFRARESSVVAAEISDQLAGARGWTRVRLATALILVGRLAPRSIVHDALRAGVEDPAERYDLVRALGREADLEDLALLREIFPNEIDFELNVEIATTLIRSGDRNTLPLLRSALWREPWNRSALAAALVVELFGAKELQQELLRPPLGATPRDRRRVGFALGEWGGLREVEILAQRARPGDPAVQGALLGFLGTRTY